MGKREDICDAALSIISEGGIRALTLPVLVTRAQEAGDLLPSVPPALMARVVRSMMAGIHWSQSRSEYELGDEVAQRFSDAAWRALGGR